MVKNTPSILEIEKIAEKFEVDPSIFLSKNGFNINGNNSPGAGVGKGNSINISMDAGLQKIFLETLHRLNKFLDKH